MKKPPRNKSVDPKQVADVPPQVMEDEAIYHQQVYDQVVKKQRPDFVKQVEKLKKKLKR
jgi:hypothetical protein